MLRLLCFLLTALALAACRREPPVPTDDAAPAAAAISAPLVDVVEATPRYLIGISYPKQAARYPGLARALRDYAAAARGELQTALGGDNAQTPPVPYDLSLSFTMLMETPRLVAVAADGSSWTGGAHGKPLIARFVWLPQEQRMLTAQALVPEARGWQAISAFVREQLHTALSQRLDAHEVPPDERAEMQQTAGAMIDAGTVPSAASFAQFEPVPGPDGRLVALRFVFPPYQVGPYADGTQTVEVPAEVLLPHVAPAWRSLFRGG
jgi:hypothetical protein